jgi:hypothetical protein
MPPRPRLLPAMAALFVTLCPLILRGEPNLADKIARPLRYQPEGGSFVISNGTETFNRPLYGLNTAFRVDAGDLPELSLYLPGRGGNLRLGVKTAAGAKWFNDADNVVARYGDGVMRYEVRDALLRGGTVNITAAAMHATEGALVRLALSDGAAPCEIVCAYGGANGATGRRGGDIGAESEPVSTFFRLKPGDCAKHRFEINGSGFVLETERARILGVMPQGTQCAVANAEMWDAADELLASAGAAVPLPVVVARVPLESGQPRYLALQRLTPITPGKADLSYLLPAYQPAELPRVFDGAEAYWRRLAGQVTVKTPDAFINAAVPALCIAADGVWDGKSKAFMHGAVAWRNKLLGWRGAYTGDALGWHHRTRDHLRNWFPRQNADPIDPAQTAEPAIVPQDASVRLARNEPVLHSNGDLTNSHYDMNLVAIDAFFRHLLWTGDLDFARESWPVVERHLAWERRLFRRPFGSDKLPLYEAYCCIWASDDLQYHGGGVTHASAYNAYHNAMAARVAKLIGKDPAPYEHEAELILQAMRRELWLADRGWFAEWRDSLGLQLAHPSAALWTFYHTIDSEVANPLEAWQMSRFVDTQIPHIPIAGDGIPSGHYTLSTTSWMPYTWSTNNVVMGEAAHASLAYWQAGRGEEAFALYKGLLLDSMFQGLCPGNVGMATKFDMARGETQRDFADGVGATSRALVEGLFGVKADALGGKLTVQPGFPVSWDSAEIRHPDFDIAFKRRETTETYTVASRFSKPMALRLVLPALRDDIGGLLINGQPGAWRTVEGVVGRPRVLIESSASPKIELVITWKGEPPAPPARARVDEDGGVTASFGKATVLELSDPQGALTGAQIDGSTIHAAVAGAPGHRTAFAKLQQGGMTWYEPITFEIRKRAAAYPMTDWTRQPPLEGTWDIVDLTGVLNDRVTQIFQNEYRSPRSPYCSLAIPLQGIGSWVHFDPRKDKAATANIDDTGLRMAAERGGGRVVLPQGVPFQTAGPGGADNVAFTSQWDNYRRDLTVPLTGKATHLYLLMAGSTNAMQSRFDNGEVLVNYVDGSTDRLPLENPTTWWPIEQDYRIDDFAFARPEPLPLRVDLKTGNVRVLDHASFKGKGGRIDGGSATVLDLKLHPERELRSLTVRTLANEVVIGLMSATLLRS